MEARQADRGRVASEISNAIVGLHREHYGRGAVRARTVINGDFVLCVLDDILTPAERTLLRAGKADTVRATRHAFQEAVSHLFTDAVSRATGRRVVAFMSQVHFDPDLAAEIFVLEPESRDSALGNGAIAHSTNGAG